MTINQHKYSQVAVHDVLSALIQAIRNLQSSVQGLPDNVVRDALETTVRDIDKVYDMDNNIVQKVRSPKERIDFDKLQELVLDTWDERVKRAKNEQT